MSEPGPAERSGSPGGSAIVTLGDLVLDVVARMTAPLAAASDAPGIVRFRQGGSAANTARMVARLGAPAVFVGAIGRDPWGSLLVRSLESAGVTVHVTRVALPTARIAVLVTSDGERSFVTERGAADLLRSGDLRLAWFRGAAALHLPAYSLLAEPLASAAATAMRLTRDAGGLVSIDLASSRPLLAGGRAAAWRRLAATEADLLFGNAAEAAALLGSRPVEHLLELASVVAIKRGAAGCEILARPGIAPGRRVTSGPIRLEVATRPIAVSDTTGAGDAFDAGFLLEWSARVADGTAAGAPGRALRSAALSAHRAAARHLRTRHQEIVPGSEVRVYPR